MTSFREIGGKRVSIGHPGSGNLHTVRVMLEAFGMSEADFSPALLDPARAYDSLRAGQIDCLFSTVGIGSTAIRELAGFGDVVLVELAEPELDALIRAKPYYAYATLTAGSYPGSDRKSCPSSVSRRSSWRAQSSLSRRPTPSCKPSWLTSIASSALTRRLQGSPERTCSRVSVRRCTRGRRGPTGRRVC